MTGKKARVIELLRRRLSRALATGALRAGDRVPSTREVAAELSVDPRLVSAAYGELALEGIVEQRARSGTYVTMNAANADDSTSASRRLAEFLSAEVLAGRAAPTVVRSLQHAVTDRALKTMVIATTADQGLGLARELRDDFGLDASSLLAERLKGGVVPDSMKRAQLLVSTPANASLVAAIAAEHGRRHVVISVRTDLFSAEWLPWKNEIVHVVVLDPRFRAMTLRYLRETRTDVSRFRMHLANDNLSGIADDEPTYVTQAARAFLGKTRIPGMLIPPTRLLRDDCVRELWEAVIELNTAAAERAARRLNRD